MRHQALVRRGDDDWQLVRPSDIVTCCARKCNHDEIQVQHETGHLRVREVILDAEPVSRYGNRLHYVVMEDGTVREVRQQVGTYELSCCTLGHGERYSQGRRSRSARTTLTPDTHMLAVLDALGWLRMVAYAATVQKKRLEAKPQPAPAMVAESTLFDDHQEHAPRKPVPADFAESPSPNIRITRHLANGERIEYHGPDNATSRAIAQSSPAAAIIPLVQPEDILVPEVVAHKIASTRTGLAADVLIQACVDRMRPGTRVDMPRARAFLQSILPRVQEILRDMNRDLIVNHTTTNGDDSIVLVAG